jgi:sugar lactone lactonase YvrE
MADEGLDVFADGFSFLEFPRWYEGRLWAADMFAAQVVAFAGDGAAQVVMTVPEVLAGFGWMPDGALLVVTRGGRLLRQQAGQVTKVASPLRGGPMPCNEMTVDGQGRAYIGLFGLAGGGLARADPDGSARLAAQGMLLPNGQALSADGRTLIVAESAGQRLSAFTVGVDGSLTGRRVWAAFGEPATATTLPEVIAQVSVWPDGIALDAAGAVWVANPFGREVLRVVEGGQITDRLSAGALACYACALGGPDGHTLFVCAAPPFLDEAARRTRRSARLLTCHVSVPAANSPANRAMP